MSVCPVIPDVEAVLALPTGGLVTVKGLPHHVTDPTAVQSSGCRDQSHDQMQCPGPSQAAMWPKPAMHC